jgi:hypothetical protein
VKVFIAGIMQGSRLDRFIDKQDYRRIIAQAIQDYDASASIIDPNELHPHGVDYGDAEAKATLLEIAEMAAQADLLVAYAPRASMGTAIEMWQAFRARIPIVTVSPLEANWVVKHLSDVVLADLSAFQSWVADDGLPRLLSRGVS